MNKQQFLQAVTWEATRILKNNAPVRDAYRLAPNGKYYKTYSKYGQPGNLKNKGIRAKIGKFHSSVVIGGAPAPYGPITEYTSRKKGWIAKSKNELINRLETAYGAKRI